MTVAVIALSIALVSALGLTVFAVRGWLAEKGARLAEARRADEVTKERDAALAANATAVARAEAAEDLALAGQHGTARAAKEDVDEVRDARTAADVINIARRHDGLPPLSASGVPDVPAAAPTEADPTPSPDAVRGPDDAA